MPERIERIEPRPRERVRVTLSGGRFFTIPAPAAEGLREGAVLDDDALARLDRMDQYGRGRDRALRLLARRARTRHELGAALAADGITEPVRRGILAELEEQGLVDDRRFAVEYARSRAEARFHGPHRLRHDLRRLGVARADVDAAIEAVFGGEEQAARARALVARRLGDGPVDERAVRRIVGLLRRRGYDYEVVGDIAASLLRRIDHSPGDE